MECQAYEGGCGLNLNMMVKKDAVLAAFPLHTWPEKAALEEQTLILISPPWEMPVDVIKDYFGEKVGVYFLFLSHYTVWFIFSGIVGVGVYIHESITGNIMAWSIPPFCVFMGMWTT